MKTRYPPIIEKGKCRGCGSSVPKGRLTWCSTECFEKHDPATARWKVKQRDKGVCAMCGVDTEKMKRRCPPLYGWGQLDGYDRRFTHGGFFDKQRFDRAVEARMRHGKRRNEAAIKRRSALSFAGWPHRPSSHWWEADHIIPYSEGGTYELSNMRTLCIPCHKRRTKLWHKSRKAVKSGKQLELA